MTLRVLVFDDGEVPTEWLCAVLQHGGADVVRLVNLFEAHRVLDSQHFDVVVGHEILLLLAGELKLTSRRCLLAATPAEWTPPQLDVLGASAVISAESDAAAVLWAVGLCP